MANVKNNKFRASYSILSAWSSGNWENAVRMYFKLDTFTSPAMVAGKQYHTSWAEQISRTKTLPDVFFPVPLKNPMAEIKKVVQLNEWLDLVGKVDCYDKPVIYEFKTGKRSSESYANDQQIGIYAVLLTYSGLYVEKGEIYHYDQYSKKSDMSVRYITDKYLKDSLNWIETMAGDMHNYLLQNDMYIKYANRITTTEFYDNVEN